MQRTEVRNISQLDQKTAFLDNIVDLIRYNPPYVVSIELTYRCPMQCLYCHNPPEMIRDAGIFGQNTLHRVPSAPILRSINKKYIKELNTEEWLKIIRKVRDLEPANFIISGGEPLLRDDLYKIIEEATNQGLDPFLLTSGSIVSHSIADRLKGSGLKKIRINVSSHITLDLVAHESLLRVISKRIEAIEIFKEHGLYVQVGILYIRPYVSYLEKIVKMCVEAGADLVEIHHMARFGHGFYNYEFLKPRPEDIAIIKDLKERLEKSYGERIFFAVDPDIVTGRKPYPNMWGLTGLVIAPDGAIFPSEEATALGEVALLGNALKDDIQDIWINSVLLNKLRSLKWLREPCKSCVIRDMCRGGSRFLAYIVTGDLYAPDPTCPLVIERNANHHKKESRVSV